MPGLCPVSGFAILCTLGMGGLSMSYESEIRLSIDGMFLVANGKKPPVSCWTNLLSDPFLHFSWNFAGWRFWLNVIFAEPSIE